MRNSDTVPECPEFAVFVAIADFFNHHVVLPVVAVVAVISPTLTISLPHTRCCMRPLCGTTPNPVDALDIPDGRLAACRVSVIV